MSENCTEIRIGRTAENEARVVRFNVSDWQGIYGPGGAFILMHQRPNDDEPYICQASVAEDGWLEWVVKAADLQRTGRGQLQLSYVVNEQIAKSMIFTTRISRSLDQSGELPEPYEDMIEELIEAAADIVIVGQQVAADKAAADEDALKAEGHAVGKQNGEDVPSGSPYYHNNAKYYAEQAGGSAQAAADSAGDANTAKGKAEDAQTAAETAQGKAEDAQTAAETAQGKAEDAQTAAETAQGKAEDAQEAAEAAAETAEEYAENAAPAIINSASGAIASFSDGAGNRKIKSLVVNIKPVQDLHGQDAPYPAGGEANKLPPSNTVTKTREQNGLKCVIGDDGIYTFSGATSGGSYDQTCSLPETYVIQDGDNLHLLNTMTSNSAMAILMFTDNSSISVYFSSINKIQSLSAAVGKTISKLRVYVASGATLNATISPMIVNSSSVTPWKPYSNICPITGRTGCEVSHLELPVGYTAVDYVNINDASINIDTSDFIETFNVDNLVVGVEFKINSSSQYKPVVCTTYLGENYNTIRIIRNNANDQLLFNNNWKTSSSRALSVPTDVFNSVVIAHGGYYLNDYYESLSPAASGDPNSAHSFLICGEGSNIDYRWIYIRTTGETGNVPKMVLVPCKNSSGVAGFYDIVNNRFHTTNDSSKITAYGTLQKPQYQKSFLNVSKYNADWEDEAGTVYSGTYNFVSGEGVADFKKIIKNSTSGWVRGSAQGYYFEQNDLPTPDGTQHDDVLCNELKPSVSGFNTVWRDATYKTINIRTEKSYASVAEMVADLGELEFLYPLETPITFTLTPQQIKTLYNYNNNIFSNAGDVNVEYVADTKLYVDNKIAEMIASAMSA